jgi:N-dimethylarginine dimethylaminohydrolase
MTMPSAQTPCFLMCEPRHFAVTYAINPWMNPGDWAKNARTLTANARRAWEDLRDALLGCGATVDLVPARRGRPDMVFTANAAVVLDRKALLARFRHPERQLEQPAFAKAFRALQARGIVDAVSALPPGIVLEGAGDCIWDANRDLFWMGHGQRSDAAARHAVETTFDADVVPIELVDPRFYHLDTAMCPLTGGEVIYVPSAFAPASRGAFEAHVRADQRIEVPIEDACRLSANAVCLGHTLLLSGCGPHLRAVLEERGYRVIAVPLDSFLRSGGAAFCLTLRLDRRSSRSIGPAEASDSRPPSTLALAI